MNLLKVTLLGTLALAAGCFDLSAQTRASPLAQSPAAGVVSGFVLDADGARIAGTTVWVRRGRFVQGTRSGEDGAFTIGLPAGTYRLTAHKGGFRVFTLPALRVRAQVTQAVRVRLAVQEPPGLQKLRHAACAV